MYQFADQHFGLSEVPWIEVPFQSDQLEAFELRCDAAGLKHRAFYNAPTEKKHHSGRVMLVRVPRPATGESWEVAATYARRVVRGEFAAIDIPDILEELRSKPVIPRDPSASSSWLDTAPGTGARDVERALFMSLGTRTSSADVTRDTLKIIGLYLTRLSHAQKSLNLDHDGYQTIQWLTENWHRGDARSVYLLYHPDEATEDDSRKNFWWGNEPMASARQPARGRSARLAGAHVPTHAQRALARSAHSELPWRADRLAQSHAKQASPIQTAPKKALDRHATATVQPTKEPQSTDGQDLPRIAPGQSHAKQASPIQTAPKKAMDRETPQAPVQPKEPHSTNDQDHPRIAPGQTRKLLRRLTAKSRQRAAEQRPPAELVWKPGKSLQGVTSEVAELPDGTTLSLVKGSRSTTSALFHDATPIASGSVDQLRAHASVFNKHVDARKWFK